MHYSLLSTHCKWISFAHLDCYTYTILWTQWDLNKMADILLMIFTSAFCWNNFDGTWWCGKHNSASREYRVLWHHLKSWWWCLSNQHWFKVMGWCQIGDKPLLELIITKISQLKKTSDDFQNTGTVICQSCSSSMQFNLCSFPQMHVCASTLCGLGTVYSNIDLSHHWLE